MNARVENNFDPYLGKFSEKISRSLHNLLALRLSGNSMNLCTPRGSFKLRQNGQKYIEEKFNLENVDRLLQMPASSAFVFPHTKLVYKVYRNNCLTFCPDFVFVGIIVSAGSSALFAREGNVPNWIFDCRFAASFDPRATKSAADQQQSHSFLELVPSKSKTGVAVAA